MNKKIKLVSMTVINLFIGQEQRTAKEENKKNNFSNYYFTWSELMCILEKNVGFQVSLLR